MIMFKLYEVMIIAVAVALFVLAIAAPFLALRMVAETVVEMLRLDRKSVV